MDNKKPESIRKDDHARREFWGTILLDATLLLVFGYAFAAILQSEASLIVYLGRAVFLAALFITASSMILAISRQHELGLKLIYYSLLVIAVAVTTLFHSRAIPATILIVIVSIICQVWLFPRNKVWQYSAAAAAALAVIWGVEWLAPSWRQNVEMAEAGPLGALAYGVIFGIFLLIQARKTIIKSLQLKIAFWTGATLAVVSLTLIAHSSITARQNAIETAKNEALAFAASQANLVRADSEVPLDTARAVAQALTAAKDPENTYRNLSRSQVNAVLRQVLIENPEFLGTYTLWEPDAFDGQDAFYRGKEAHDLTGRFIPYWIRDDSGNVNVIPLEGYETPGIGDWYILPRLTKQEVVIAPLIYPINGVDTVMASFIAPVIYDGKFYGIAGMDAPITYVQKVVNTVEIYDGKAEAFLITSSGRIIGFRNRPDLVNQSITEVIPNFFSGSQTRVVAGEAFTSISPDGQSLYVFAPVNIGKTNVKWSFGLIIPFSEITATATIEAVRAGAIGLFLTLLGLFLLWVLSGQITRPMRDLTTVANAVSQGSLDVTATVKTTDETGVLANAFNLMLTQLRETFNTLEQRVAERTHNLELAAEVGRAVSQVHSLDVLLKDACELILKEFDLYYVQVYLVDPSHTLLKLEAGTGNVGAQLIGLGHSLPLDAGSINGRAATEKHSVVIPDIAQSATFRRNALLPDTRGEMAVPLIIADKIVGVLDMQSNQAGILTEESLPAFEALAGQMAVAIQNARLTAEAEQARAEVESIARRLTRSGWKEYLDGIHKPEKTGFIFENGTINPIGLKQEQTKENTLVAPISITGETLGNLAVEIEGKPLISHTEELMNTVAHQVSQHIENLRLLDSAERFRYEAEQASRRLAHEGWQEYMAENSIEGLQYVYDLNEVRPLTGDEEKLVNEDGVSLPLKVHDEAVGRIIVKDIKDEDAAALINTVAERLSAHIEGLRLSMQTEKALTASKKQAQREQALRQITSAVRSSNDPAVILRTAARELGGILGRQTVVKLATTDQQETNPALGHPTESAEKTVVKNEDVSIASAEGAVGGSK